jgi:hypothetical protein
MADRLSLAWPLGGTGDRGLWSGADGSHRYSGNTGLGAASIGPVMPTEMSSMRSLTSLVPRLASTGTATLLALAMLSGLAYAADDPSPPASPSAPPEAQASPASEPQGLGGNWRRMARGPFGAVGVPGGWTGLELIVVDPEQKRRAAAWDPVTDTWRTIARPPWKVRPNSSTYWTGTELVFVEERKAGTRGLAAYDPVTDKWRTSSPAPFADIAASVWADGVIVAGSGSDDSFATYDPVTDAWTDLPPMPGVEGSTSIPVSYPSSLYWTGDEVFALTATSTDTEATLTFTPLDLAEGSWGAPSTGPLSSFSGHPLWTGESFVFLSGPDDPDGSGDEPPRDGHYDPANDAWAVTDNRCGLDTSDAVWTDTLILDAPVRLAYDPASDQCYTLPPRPSAERSQTLRLWTGREVLEWSGTTGEDSAVRRDGIAYQPPSEDATLEALLDKRSRPVRIRIPSLDIDLPVISTDRRVKGSTRGYPACDVALRWTAFEQPGKPGTTWILAHAQPGMFLPLLETVLAQGRGSLAGRRVELQLRDGRLLTYRTYWVKPRAGTSDLRIATKGRRNNEQRLVLQTSTGVGSAPKLQVAARLVDVTTTDEQRPRPRPRACG